MALKSAYLTGILAHIPEGERGKAEAEFEALEKGGLRQSDYSKLADEAKAAQDRFDALYAANTEWFETRKAELSEVDALRTKVADLEKRPAVGTVDLPKDLITKKELIDTIAALERDAAGFIADSGLLSLQHFQQFGEVLNTRELLADKRVSTLGIQGVYAEKYKDQIAAKAKAVEDAKAETLRKEGYDKARAEFSNRPPYPVVGNEPSALDAIEAARSGEKPAVKSLDEIAAEYARLGATRAGASA